MIESILIVDDEPLARKLIKDYLEKMEYSGTIKEASDAIVAQKILSTEDIDLLFLDINMPLMSGIELAKEGLSDVMIIFTTAHADFAVEAFEVAAFDYLVKPISFSRFQKSFQRAEESFTKPNVTDADWMLVKEGKRIYKVPYGDIFYMQAYGDYVKIYTDKKTYVMKARLTNVEKDVPSQFVRCHRSYVLNVKNIAFLEGNYIETMGEKIPISDSYRESVMNKLQ